MRTLTPIDGYADWIGPAMTPDSPPSAAPKAKTSVNTRPMSIPSPAAISASYTPARITAPRRVFSITSQSRTATSRPKAMTKSRYAGKVRPPTVTRPEKSSGVGIERMRPPQPHLTRSSKR